MKLFFLLLLFPSFAHAYAAIIFFDVGFLTFMLETVPLYGGLGMIAFETLVIALLLKPKDFMQAGAALAFAVAGTMLFAIILAVVIFFMLGETLLEPHVPAWMVYSTVIYFYIVVVYMGYLAKRSMLSKIMKEDEAFVSHPRFKKTILVVNALSFAAIFAFVAAKMFIL